MNITIYGIFNHVKNECIYVGRTRNFKVRCHPKRYKFLKGIEGNISFEILERVPFRESPSAEFFWIQNMRFLGCRLMNKMHRGTHLMDIMWARYDARQGQADQRA